MLRDEKLYDDLGKVAAQTLIIHGVQDKVIPFAQAKELNRKIRNSYLVPFQYSGHGPFWEEREMFNRILTQLSVDSIPRSCRHIMFKKQKGIFWITCYDDNHRDCFYSL